MAAASQMILPGVRGKRPATPNANPAYDSTFNEVTDPAKTNASAVNQHEPMVVWGSCMPEREFRPSTRVVWAEPVQAGRVSPRRRYLKKAHVPRATAPYSVSMAKQTSTPMFWKALR